MKVETGDTGDRHDSDGAVETRGRERVKQNEVGMKKPYGNSALATKDNIIKQESKTHKKECNHGGY